jgi:hypothetical protein
MWFLLVSTFAFKRVNLLYRYAMATRAQNSVGVITKSWHQSLLWVYMMKWRGCTR